MFESTVCSYKLPETPRYTMDVVKDEAKAKRNLDKVMVGDGKWDDDYFNPVDADRYAFPYQPKLRPLIHYSCKSQ